jgi:hypothetical protein
MADIDAVAAREVLARLLRLAFEVLGGRRPLSQLDAVAAPLVCRYIRAAL